MDEETPPTIKNKKHQRFADRYLANGMNATQAYMFAYNKTDEQYTTCATNGGNLLRNTYVKAYIQWHMKNEVMTRDEVLRRLRGVASADIGELFVYSDAEKSFIFDFEMAKEKGLTWLIKEITQEDTIVQTDDDTTVIKRRYKVKLHDAHRALMDIAKVLGFNAPKKVELEGFPQVIQVEYVNDWRDKNGD